MFVGSQIAFPFITSQLGHVDQTFESFPFFSRYIKKFARYQIFEIGRFKEVAGRQETPRMDWIHFLGLFVYNIGKAKHQGTL